MNERNRGGALAGIGLGGALALMTVAACKPDLDQTVSVVSAPVVLAVQSNPAEVAPTKAVELTALYVDRNGRIDQGPLSWDFCNARNPLANLGSVNPECLQASGAWFQPIGAGVMVGGPVPDLACQQFGPLVPPAVPGQPQGRPVDPDPTGGYYQPSRFFAPSDGGTLTGIAETRLTCGPGGITGAGAMQYNRRYHPNANPAVASLSVVAERTLTSWTEDVGGASPLRVVEEDAGMEAGAVADAGVGTPNVVKAGAQVTLRVAWADCPLKDSCGDGICGPDEGIASCPSDCATPAGCPGAERFLNVDIAAQSVLDDREALGVAWFATGGSFGTDRTGRDSTDPTTSSDNAWTAPSLAGTVHLWVVLRDSRGGTAWGQYSVQVQ